MTSQAHRSAGGARALSFQTLSPSQTYTVASTTDGQRTAQHLIEPDNWEPDEWNELISGRMGEWAMAIHDW